MVSFFENSVVLPAFNEEQALPAVLGSLIRVLDERSEIVVVDDGSSDATAEIAGRFPCRVVRHLVNRGKGAAVRTGIQAARGDLIVVMDADGSYPPEAIREMIDLSQKFDFVHGVRQYGASTMPLINRVGNGLFNKVLRRVLRFDGDDLLSGMFAIRRAALEQLDLQADGFDLEIELRIKASRGRLARAQLPVHYHRRLGQKKLRPWQDGWVILRRGLELSRPSA